MTRADYTIKIFYLTYSTVEAEVGIARVAVQDVAGAIIAVHKNRIIWTQY